MAEPFKNMYNKQFFDLFTKDLRLVIDDFDAHGFVSQIMDDEWEGRELKQRWIHITSILKKFLPADYKEAIAKILELLDHVKSTRPDFSVIDDTKFGLMLEYGVILNNYVEQYGLDDYETSVKAIEKITQFTSCEFVTHPFIIKYPDKMMKQMLVWSKHEHWGVRRLASEGCRPRLPWAMALPNLKKDPTPIIPILENLKNDPARFAHFAEKVWGITGENTEAAAKAGIQRTVAFFRELEMPTNLEELGIGEVTEEDLRELAMSATQDDTVTLSHIKPLHAEDVYQIMKRAAGK